MKRVLYGVMLCALLAAGCLPKSPFVWPDTDPSSEQTVVQPPRKHVPTVRPDQVTTENAAEKVQELEMELENDRDTSR